MFTDYLALKIGILIVLLAVLFVSFFFVFKLFLKLYREEKKEEPIPDDFSYHYKEINKKRELEQEHLTKLEEVRAQIAALEEPYEKGIFLRKNIKLWEDMRRIHEDLFRWKKNQSFPLDENEVDYFLSDIELLFDELNVELVKPVVGEMFDNQIMKVFKTVQDATKPNHMIVEVVKYGYKLVLDDKTKLLQEAEVVIVRN